MGKGPIGRGAASPAFRDALAEINLECARVKKQGVKVYINKTDAKTVYAKHGGACAVCGYPLRSHKRGTDSLAFMFYQPLRYGGKAERDNLLPVCRRCREKQTPAPRAIERIPNVNTIADLIDRLIVEVHKLAYFENQKRLEHGSPYPDEKKIVEWDNKSRDCCELRSILKRELNTAIEEFVCTMVYTPKAEARTFRAPKIINGNNTIADSVDEMAFSNAIYTIEAEKPSVAGECPARDNLTEFRKDCIDEALESIRLTKQYKIIKE